MLDSSVYDQNVYTVSQSVCVCVTVCQCVDLLYAVLNNNISKYSN